MRQNKEVTVYYKEGSNPFPDSCFVGKRYAVSLKKVRDWLAAIEAEVPNEYRNALEINIGTEHDYDIDIPYLDISYSRPETDAEVEERVERDRAMLEERQNRERAEFERLKKKFGE